MIIKNINLATSTNSYFLKGKALKNLEIFKGIDIEIENGFIKKISKTKANSESKYWVIPGLVDSHSHPIFCGERSEEIDLRKKIGYEGVLKNGGGIYRTVDSTNNCSEDQLFMESSERIKKMIKNGTTSIEMKTGYGLNLKSEEKMVNVMERIEREYEIKIKKTLLAHVPPKDTDEKDFINDFKDIIDKLASRIDYVDVFIDEGAFSPQFAREIFIYANRKKIPGRVHVNEIKNLNAIELLKDLDIKTFDHMLETKDEEIAKINGIINFLPFTSIILKKNMNIFEKFRDSDKIISMGSDISPNSYNLSMLLAIGLARQLSPFTIEELINMATINSAYSLNLSNLIGSIEEGKRADMIILNSSFKNIGYIFGEDLINEVIVNGKQIMGNMETNLIQ